MSLRSRVAALEQVAGIDGFTIINVHGGFGALGGPYASADQGRLHWTPIVDETVAKFRSRAIAEAREAGQKFIVFGGLPR